MKKTTLQKDLMLMKILITGVSGGIGLYLAERLIADGRCVFGADNRTNPADSLSDRCSEVDITDSRQASRWVRSVTGPADQIVLINCAGINYNAFAHKADIDRWRKVVDVNLAGTFNMIQAVLLFMREKAFGRIINFSSVVAQKGIPGTSAYAASKAALWGLTKSIAAENATRGITINTLNLGYFDIGMIKDVPEEMLAEIMKTIPSKKLGNPKNIYHAVKFLIESDYITGTSIDINGGLF